LTTDTAAFKMAGGAATWLLLGLICMLYIVYIEGTSDPEPFNPNCDVLCTDRTRAESFCRADVVFNGTLIRFKQKRLLDRWSMSVYVNVYAFSVDTVFKNDSPEQNLNRGLTRVMSVRPGECASDRSITSLNIREAYLIEALYNPYARDYTLVTTPCSLNTGKWADLTPEEKEMYINAREEGSALTDDCPDPAPWVYGPAFEANGEPSVLWDTIKAEGGHPSRRGPQPESDSDSEPGSDSDEDEDEEADLVPVVISWGNVG